jgi:hypothetical protein
MGGYASSVNQNLEWLSKFGLKIDPGVDLDDVMKHPEKYADKDLENDVEIKGMEEFLTNMEALKSEAIKAQTDLAAGKTQSATQIAAKLDNIHGILLIDPNDYADPMNVIMQKMNYTVFQRKSRLYIGYLRSSTNKTFKQVKEVLEQANRKISEVAPLEEAELDKLLEEKRIAEEKMRKLEVTDFQEAEWRLRLHDHHTKYFNTYNNIAETSFGSATNVASIAYVQKIKPMVEAYYYDVFRHVAMISDPEVRKQKNTELNNNIHSALDMALKTVLAAYGSFSYSDEWDCDCDLEELLAAREKEKEEEAEEENARIERNKAAKAVFDSGEIPEASPLFKRLDAYKSEQNYGLFKVTSSCARSTVEINTDMLSLLMKIPVSVNYSSTTSEFTGAATRNAGVKVGLDLKTAGDVKASTNVNLNISVSSDGKGNVTNYSVTAGAEVGVKVGNYSAGAGVGANVSKNNGVTDYSVSGDVKVSVKYNDTQVSGGASANYSMSKGLESDFSAKISQDFKNSIGTSANVTAEVSTKRGCSMSYKVEQTLTPVKESLNAVNEKMAKDNTQMEKDAKDGKDTSKYKDNLNINIPTDMLTRELWSGSFGENKDKK